MMRQTSTFCVVLLSALCSVAACTSRTVIVPTEKQEEQQVYVPPSGCNVRDFPSATDVPEGARNLGWVEVEEQGSDEETFLLLRQKVCELGGDALSQPAWEKGPTEERPRLTGNAWVLP